MELFLNTAAVKLQKIPIYDQAYPGLAALLAKLSRKLYHTARTELQGFQEKREDSIFYHYLNEQQAKAEKAGSYFFKVDNEDNKHIGSYIAENKYYHDDLPTWKSLFFMGAALKRYNSETATQEDVRKDCSKVYRFAQLLLKNYELTQPANRLCCSKFFYMNFDVSPIETGHLLCRPRNDCLKNRVHRLYERQEGRNASVKLEEKEEAE